MLLSHKPVIFIYKCTMTVSRKKINYASYRCYYSQFACFWFSDSSGTTKTWSILAQWAFLLPLFQHMQNITELNVLLQSKWGKERIDIRNVATSLGFSVGFVFTKKQQ